MVLLIGAGPGTKAGMTAQGVAALQSAQCILGAERLKPLADCISAPFHAMVDTEKIAAFVKEHQEYETFAVLLSGDVGFYSGAKKLLAALENEQTQVFCGVSSLVYFCAGLGLPWQDVYTQSLHGREGDPLKAVLRRERVFFLTGKTWRVQDICNELTAVGLGCLRCAAGENLSYPDERIVKGRAEELAGMRFGDLAVLLVENGNPTRAPSSACGLPDELFERGESPMTKSEVRAVSLSKLAPCREDIIYDVGAGTGSVAVELSFLTDNRVYAIEREPAACLLSAKNRARFGAYNMVVVEGEAPKALKDLPPPDCAFIGGSGGALAEILALLLKKNPAVRVVINALTLETLFCAMTALQSLCMQKIDVVQLSVSKAKEVGNFHMMTAQNPIFIISATGGGARAHE